MCIQICIPDHCEDKEAEIKVNELVNSINSKFGELSHSPIHYHQRDICKDEYYALLSNASVLLNTVERDGFNPTPFEYIVCQPNGVLILSEFTGMADCLSAVSLVNPIHSKVLDGVANINVESSRSY